MSKECGVSAAYICKVERGQFFPSPEIMSKWVHVIEADTFVVSLNMMRAFKARLRKAIYERASL